ncbi:MAG: ferrous iron transport protein A [Oscillibacter sp.]|jgi:ferrous iron transport protein A|uniref:FeoA family protein n=1 Tax=uncultured Oscillibacter sp. TaxID=876091 RepID=UPI00216B68BE|nr:FeoA domain-containing protein [uncultured Oscillibacter sp.]MCI8803960.1 ferrous iron transport protein A [Oscillibacter sp.]
MLLKDMQVGETCVVENISLPFQMERRLQVLGMTRRTKISVVNRKGRGILIIKLRGSRFALGEHITASIAVRKVEAAV